MKRIVTVFTLHKLQIIHNFFSLFLKNKSKIYNKVSIIFRILWASLGTIKTHKNLGSKNVNVLHSRIVYNFCSQPHFVLLQLKKEVMYFLKQNAMILVSILTLIEHLNYFFNFTVVSFTTFCYVILNF